MVIGGLDVGSTGAKITVMNQSGQVLHLGYRDYPIDRNVTTHELNAADIWNAVKILIREAVAAAPELSAIGVTSFGESFVLLDDQGEALLPTMMYTDPRGEQEASILNERLGNDFISDISGTAAHAMYSLPKLMWIKENKPEEFAKAHCVCLILDYVVFKLTGKRYIDYSLAARTMGFDIRKKAWSSEIFEAADIDPKLFSEPVPTGTNAGEVLTEVAKELNISNKLRIVVCCHDQVAAAIGSDVMTAGIATDGGGTVQCMTPVFSPIPEGQILQSNNYPIIPFLQNEVYCSYAFSFTGGALTKWFVDNFAAGYQDESAQTGIPIYQVMEKQMTDAPTGILVLPHFAGAATPYMDAGSEGAIVGLTLQHTPSDLLKAIMEGIAYEMRLNMEHLKKGGIQINGLNATGGCAKSKLWLQVKADILGVPITRMSTDEAGTVGGIMLTGVATGVYESLEEASGMLVQPIETYYPRKDIQKQYEGHYQRYEKLYNAIRPLIKLSEER